MVSESGDGAQPASGSRKGPVRSSRAEKLKYVSPSLPRRSELQKYRQAPILRAFEHQKVHARGVRGILCPFQKSGVDECINRFRDLLYVITHKVGELFVCQERPRVPIEKDQQIEFTRAPYDRSAGKQTLDMDIRLHSRLDGGLIAHKAIAAPYCNRFRECPMRWWFG
jgi:hypothetical protein